jgi:hypothetical protein
MITGTKFHGFFYESFDKTETPLSFSTYVRLVGKFIPVHTM